RRNLSGPARRSPHLRLLTSPPATKDQDRTMKFSNLPLSRKFALCFGSILLAIAVMGGVIFFNVQALNRAGEARSDSNTDVRQTSEAAFKLARQEGSFRGLLVSGDRYYLERVGAHRADFIAALETLRDGAPPQKLALIEIGRAH